MNDSISSFQFRIDWLSFSFRVSSIATAHDIFSFFISFSGDNLIPDDIGFRNNGRLYQHSYKSIFGSMLFLAPVQDGSYYDCCASICATSLPANSMDFLPAFHYANKIHAKFTRIDLACDDYSKSLTPEFLYSRCLAGDLKGFRKFKYIHEAFNTEVGIKDSGFTLYCGSQKSDKFYRIYDKNLESKGLIDAIRFEFVAKNSYAQKIADLFRYHLNSPDAFPLCSSELPDDSIELEFSRRASGMVDLISSIIFGNLFFIDRSSDSNVSRCVSADYYSSFLSLLNSSLRKLSVISKKPRLYDSLQWLLRSCSGTLSMIRKYMASKSTEFLHLLFEVGDTNFESNRRLQSLLKQSLYMPSIV